MLLLLAAALFKVCLGVWPADLLSPGNSLKWAQSQAPAQTYGAQVTFRRLRVSAGFFGLFHPGSAALHNDDLSLALPQLFLCARAGEGFHTDGLPG